MDELTKLDLPPSWATLRVFEMSPLRFAVGALVVAGGLAVACGSAETHNVDYGKPPPAEQFNPGLGGGSSGYGGPQSVTPFVCPEELKRCAHTFTYPAGSETSVELRGDFGGAHTRGARQPVGEKSA